MERRKASDALSFQLYDLPLTIWRHVSIFRGIELSQLSSNIVSVACRVCSYLEGTELVGLVGLDESKWNGLEGTGME